MKDTRILITGGSGFIGTNAMNYCISNKWQVKNIDIEPPKEKAHFGFWEKVDICDHISLKSAIYDFNPSYILHLAAKTGMDLKSLDEVPANIEGVKNIIEISNKLPDLKRVLFTSSLLVCKNGYIPKDDNDYCPPNIYGQSKMMGEQIIRNSKTNFEWAIVRPTSIWGPWFKDSYLSFFQMINRNLYFHPGKDDKIKPKSYVGNTVHMMFKLLFAEKKDVQERVFYLADYPQGTTREWAECIAKSLGKKRIVTLPLPLLRFVATFGDILKITGIEFPLTNFRLSNMLTGAVYPIENTKAIVGDLPYSLQDGVNETIAWMRAQKLL